MLEHQAPIILHYITLMAENTNVLKFWGPDAELGSHFRARNLLFCPKVLQGWETKGRWWKAFLNPWIHMFNMEEPASCASCEGRVVSPATSSHLYPAFSRVHCSSRLRVCVLSGAGVLVSKQNTGGSQQMVTNHHLHHHSALFVPMQSIWAPNTLWVHWILLFFFFFLNNVIGHSTAINLVPDTSWGRNKNQNMLLTQ